MNPRDWFRVVAAEATDTEPASADVYIYEEIGERWYGGGVSAKMFTEQIGALDVDVIRLHLNSPGGAAWEGVTIMNALRQHRARVEVTVDGLAASAASIIAMAGDQIVMNRGSQMMVHDPWGYAVGAAKDMRDYADALDKLAVSLADVYAARAGYDRAHWREVMQAETWYTAEEAVEAGLADSWVDAPTADAAAAAHFDLSRFGYAYAGRESAPAPRIAITDLPVSSEPGRTTKKEEDVMAYDDLKEGLRTRLGVTDAEPADEVLLAALDEALAESETTPENTVVVDAAAFAELQQHAADGRAARDEQIAVRRDGIVAQALADGRIAPAARTEWRAALDRDEDGTSRILATLPKNTVPVEEIGHADTTEGIDALAAAAGWTEEN